MRLINYKWDRIAFITNIIEMQKVLEKEYTAFEGYHSHYDKVFSHLKNKLGKPVQGDGKLLKEQTRNGEIWQRQARWDNGAQVVELVLLFTQEDWKGFSGMYRVELKIYWY